MKLSERITRWRESVPGMTKAGLARSVGVSPEAVSQWEDDDGTEPTHANVEKIAKAIGVTLAEFWGSPPANKKSTKKAS